MYQFMFILLSSSRGRSVPKTKTTSISPRSVDGVLPGGLHGHEGVYRWEPIVFSGRIPAILSASSILVYHPTITLRYRLLLCYLRNPRELVTPSAPARTTLHIYSVYSVRLADLQEDHLYSYDFFVTQTVELIVVIHSPSFNLIFNVFSITISILCSKIF